MAKHRHILTIIEDLKTIEPEIADYTYKYLHNRLNNLRQSAILLHEMYSLRIKQINDVKGLVQKIKLVKKEKK